VSGYAKKVILRANRRIIARNLILSNLFCMICKITPARSVNFTLIPLILFFGFFCSPLFSQNTSINLKDIPQRKVRKYIHSRSIDKMPDFSGIHSSWKKEVRESDFNLREKTFFLKYRLSNVWECYSHASPEKTWNARTLRLGLLISKTLNRSLYVDNSFLPAIDTGQVFFLNLRLLKGLVNAPVAFEVINIDGNQQVLEVSYIDNNKSKGKQTIQFFDNGDGRTRIVHRSYFRSGSKLYDAFVYPHFHKKFVKEFHKNMGRIVSNNVVNISASR